MKARFVYENMDFERGKDPKDTLQIGDLVGRRLKVMKTIPRLERSEEDLMLDYQTAVKYLEHKYQSEWKISGGKYPGIIELRNKNTGYETRDGGPYGDVYRGPYWVIRDLGKKGQFITYQYNKVSSLEASPVFSNRPDTEKYNPYLTWMDLSEKWGEIINNSNNIKLPDHTVW